VVGPGRNRLVPTASPTTVGSLVDSVAPARTGEIGPVIHRRLLRCQRIPEMSMTIHESIVWVVLKVVAARN
jgi:hypothetical protein